RIAQRDGAVVHFDRFDVDRASRPRSLLLRDLAFDERRDVPASVGRSRHHHARPCQPDLSDHDARLDKLAQAVAQRHIVDRDDLAAVAREADVAELDAAKECALEPADFERRRQVLISLTDDDVADPVLGPTTLEYPDGERYDDEHGGREKNDSLCQEHREPSNASWESHRLVGIKMVSTYVA